MSVKIIGTPILESLITLGRLMIRSLIVLSLIVARRTLNCITLEFIADLVTE